MATFVLGISAFYHDAAAALLVDGKIIAAAQEERFTRIKHDANFPINAVAYCIKEAGIKPDDISYVVFYDKPINKFERLLETYLSYAPLGYRSFKQALPLWLKQKLHLPREMRKGLGGQYDGNFAFIDHHESHAASAFFPSPFEKSAILTLDGVGEWSTTCYGIGHANRIELYRELRFPHSLGLLYSAFTYYIGFRVNSSEYKVMGLAAYGRPIYHDIILSEMMDLKEDGSFRMNMDYFNYCQGLTMTSKKFHDLFGSMPRKPESQLYQRDMDLAASIQSVIEEVMLKMARHLHKETRMNNLVLAGGVALNSVANGRILREGPFEKIWIQPAAGDAGGALGAAQFVWYQLLDKERIIQKPDGQCASLLGPSFSDEAICTMLKDQEAVFELYVNEDALCEYVANLIATENVVGWFQGRMEFGPRALGSRSILGDARSEKMQSIMNLKIKFRESFRPFAPMILQEHASEYFKMHHDEESPYMLFVVPIQESKRCQMPAEYDEKIGLEKLCYRRSDIPAVTHVDYTSRVQTIDKIRNPLLYRLLNAFYKKTNCPVMINTSFNIRGEPIVCSPKDAYECFIATDMDVLVLGHCILLKKDQPNQLNKVEREAHRAQFSID